ncbi:MAG: four helix bundle suffix domain-containing protein [Parcubacteria group bacterium]
MTYNNNQNQNCSIPEIISPHGGYRKLLSYQNAVIVYDLTVVFCDQNVDRFSRTKDQMVQAARSGKQNIVEGSMASGTSKKTELKLIGVARASLEELLQDYEDFLRQRGLKIWGKDDERARKIRNMSYMTNRSYKTYNAYLSSPEVAANVMICLIHQTNYLLDRQMAALARDFTENGGLTERLYNARRNNLKY